MISRLKGSNNARAMSLFVARFRNARNHWRVPIVEQRFDIWDTSYRRRFTVIIPWCTRVQHANKRHARPPDTDSIIVPREIKRLYVGFVRSGQVDVSYDDRSEWKIPSKETINIHRFLLREFDDAWKITLDY